MNIREEMYDNYLGRKDPKKLNNLIKNFYEMASQCAVKMKISYTVREDYISECVHQAYKAIEKYDPTTLSSNGVSTVKPFSYFYKVIQTQFLYSLRRDKRKNGKDVDVCSYELLLPYLESGGIEQSADANHLIAELYKDEELTSIAGRNYSKIVLLDAIKKARRHIKREIRDNQYVPNIENSKVEFIYSAMKNKARVVSDNC
jgi:DNA-directed RNA polymerase specialized sigma24 family protein